MHTRSIEGWKHEHVFLGRRHDRHERRTMCVVALTAAMMVAEIIGGSAVRLDGARRRWLAHVDACGSARHCGARLPVRSPPCGQRALRLRDGKLGELAAFASAIILAMIALFIGYESVVRLYQPIRIHFAEALPIAGLGLLVNLASAWLLRDNHAHDDDDDDAHHHDTNIRAAYVHVMADALTSVLAIIALAAGHFLGIVWLDPMMGLIGAAVILSWSSTLVRKAGAVLVDAAPDTRLIEDVRADLEIDGDRVSDLHVWRLGPGHLGVIAAIVSDRPLPPNVYKRRLAGFPSLAHVTIEVNACPDHRQVN